MYSLSTPILPLKDEIPATESKITPPDAMASSLPSRMMYHVLEYVCMYVPRYVCMYGST